MNDPLGTPRKSGFDAERQWSVQGGQTTLESQLPRPSRPDRAWTANREPIPRQEAFPRDEYLPTGCLVRRHAAHPRHVSLCWVEGAVSSH